MTNFASLTYVVVITIGVFLLPFTSVAAAQQSLKVAVLTADEKQITAFSNIFNRFEKLNPEIKIQLDFYSDLSYKKKMPAWLERGEYNLMYWQAGHRLKALVEQDLLQPIDSLLDKALLKQNVQAAALAQVTLDGQIQALPFAHYAWGIYYNKSVFKSLNLEVPQNWQDFIALCHTLKQRGVMPLVQATNESWPVLGWLDYFTLDAGGVEFREQFATLGPLNRPLIDKVINQFSDMLGHNFFFAPTHNWKWQQAIKVLLRKQAAMTFIGQFAELAINAELNDQIGFFPFPRQRDDSQQVDVEVAPLDVWMVPQAADKKNLVATLLRFLQEPEQASTLAIELNWLPVNNTAVLVDRLNERLQTSHSQLKKSDKLVQYFDRDAEPEFYDNLAKGIIQAILADDPSALNGILLSETYILSTDNHKDWSSSKKSMHVSSLTGTKGTFFASNIMQVIYDELGYSLSVSRFSTLEASLRSYRYGSDGELVRAALYENIADDLIRIPEPILTSSIYLVCKNILECEGELPADAEIAISSNILVVNNWLAENKHQAKSYKSTSAMVEDFKNSQISLMVLTESDLFDNSLKLQAGNYRTIINIPFYHYVHKKHAALVMPISNKLTKFKHSPEYKSIQIRYWLN